MEKSTESLNVMERNDFLNNLMASIAFIIHYFIAMFGSAIAGMMVIYVIFFIQIIRKKINIEKHYFIFILLIFLFFCLSFIIGNDIEIIRHYLLYFLVYSVVLMAIGTINFNIENVIKYSIFLGFVSIPIFLIKDSNLYDKMGMGYSILPIFLISIVGTITSFSKKIKICSMINIGFFGLFYVREGMRGIILAIGAFFILWMHILFVSKGNKKLRNFFAVLSSSCICLTIIIFLINLVSIVLTVSNFLEDKFKIKIYAFKKFLYYLNKGNVSNGRNMIAKDVIEMIKDSPIIGHGIGYLESSLHTYAHNIFLQATCEFGIVGFLFVLFIFMYSIKTILFIIPNEYGVNEILKKESLFFIVVFITGMFFLLYSSTYWIYGQFWFFLGILLKKYNRNKIIGRE